MSRINKVFKNKDAKILNVYCTAGYPQLNSTIEVMTALQQYGADLIEPHFVDQLLEHERVVGKEVDAPLPIIEPN